MTAPDPLTAPCSYCGAEPGRRCRNGFGYTRKPHARRVRLALALEADGTRTGTAEVAALYVAPAHKVLTELHRADPGIPPVTTGPDPSSGATVCGLQMLAVDCWLPVTKRQGDRECMECADPGSTAEQRVCEQGLF